MLFSDRLRIRRLIEVCQKSQGEPTGVVRIWLKPKGHQRVGVMIAPTGAIDASGPAFCGRHDPSDHVGYRYPACPMVVWSCRMAASGEMIQPIGNQGRVTRQKQCGHS